MRKSLKYMFQSFSQPCQLSFFTVSQFSFLCYILTLAAVLESTLLQKAELRPTIWLTESIMGFH